MKADPEVKMISAEAPILFAKGCDIFITELTMRARAHCSLPDADILVQIAAQAHAPDPQLFTGSWQNVQ